MADARVGIAEPASPSKQLDTETVVQSDGTTVHRERNEVGGAGLAEIARVENVPPARNDYGLATRGVHDVEILRTLQDIVMILQDLTLLVANLKEPYAASKIHGRMLRTSFGQQPNIG